MILPTPSEIDPLEIRRISSFTEEHPEVIELLVNVWNQATWFRNNPASIPPVFPSKLS